MIELPFAHLNLRRNPFGETGIFERTAFAIVDVARHVERLREPGRAVQFLGDKGHGKTTSLAAIRAAFPSAVYVYIGEGPPPEIPDARPLLVDEIQRLPSRLRARLFRRGVPLAVGSHLDVAGELSRAGYEVETVVVGTDLDADRLVEIASRRFEWARRGPGPLPTILHETAGQLIARHGGDLRAIEEELYDRVQQLATIGAI